MKVSLLQGMGIAACLCLWPAVSAAEPPDDGPAPPATAAEAGAKWRSPDDGWVDLSTFLDEPYGFVPVVWPITEPAIGYGAAVALAFIGKTGSDTNCIVTTSTRWKSSSPPRASL